MKWFVIFFYLFTVGLCSSNNCSKKNGESPEEYATRLLARHAYESNDEYEVRIAFLKVLKPNLPIWKNYDYLKYITIDGSSTNRPPYVPKYLEDIIQKTGESSDKYYKRIFKRYPEESDYEYMERISILRGLLNLENIWIDNDFMRYVTPYILKRVEDDFSNRKSSPSSIEQQHKTDDGQSDYYKNLKRRSDESAKGYYKRILTRHAYESNDEFEVRIAFLQPLTPSLPIWKNYEYLNYITVENNSSRPPYEPKYLENLVQKKDENTDEYYKRIFEWHSDENEYQYMERVSILRGLLNAQTIWMDNNFMTYVKPHILKSLQKELSSKHYNI